MFEKTKVAPEKYDRLREVLGWVNDYVKETGYVAGTKQLTIADLAILASYSTMRACGDIVDFSAYPALNEWFEKVKAEVPNYEKANGEGATGFGQWFQSSVKN